MVTAWPCILVYAMLISLMLSAVLQHSNASVSAETLRLIHTANKNGPYLGLVIPNSFELNPLLQSPNFTSANLMIEFSGRRFRFGTIAKKVSHDRTLYGIATQLLLSLFNIEGVVHYGISGNANPSFHIADVVVPQYWSHTALWNEIWNVVQRYGKGPEYELSLESQGDYTREIGYFKFANYAVNVTSNSSNDNMLNNISYQPEEVFPIDGTPEQRQHAPLYFEISKKLEIEYQGYFPTISPLDMESASVALICLQQRMPIIVIRALSSGLTGGGSGDPTEAGKFISLSSKNSVTAVVEFIKQL